MIPRKKPYSSVIQLQNKEDLSKIFQKKSN